MARLRHVLVCGLAASALCGCGPPADSTLRILAPPPQRSQTVVLFATPKILKDFANPDAGASRFMGHYAPLTSRARETILIFAVGNSDHILTYRGLDYWSDTIEWARYTDFVPVSDRVLDYRQLAGIVRAFKRYADSTGLNFRIFDQIDSGLEFTQNVFKLYTHPECLDTEWGSYDIRGRLVHDERVYASAPLGIMEGAGCGEFLASQVSNYTHDLGFDGILYGNQLGTRGRWNPDDGPGYSAGEESAIRDFLWASRRAMGAKGLIWFDSYNNTRVEHDTWSFPSDGYQRFDFVIASGFCVITFTNRYLDDLASKLRLPDRPRILATLDYVDPWYTYNSMTAYPDCSARLEQIAIDYRDQIDGVVFFANDEVGAPVPRNLVESFAARFFGNP